MPAPGAADRLGLALAGGGFRATLFHIGVLRRLAELDLLRSVEVISTVSGGSIAGAVYILRLKQWLEQHGQLTRAQYIQLVKEVDDILCDGIDRNLRTRLLLNPLVTMRLLLTQHSMGRAMARLYERHIFARAVQGIETLSPVKRSWYEATAGAVRLSDVCITPKGADLSAGIDAYNRRQLASPNGSVITRIVLNATSLNSGGRFQFSAVDIGDWYLGHFRRDELADLIERKELLRRYQAKPDEPVSPVAPVTFTNTADSRKTEALARWYWERSNGRNPQPPAEWAGLYEFMKQGRFPGDLPDTSLGLLRQAKDAAWYLRYGYERTPPVTGGATRAEHWRHICMVLSDIDADLARFARARLQLDDRQHLELFLDYLLELYLVRTADRVSPNFADDWDRLTLGDAVGASACFPPVFPPLILLGIYDDTFVARLGLTDGGVYDNSGVVALLDEGCTSIIASDTGAPFEQVNAAPRNQFTMMPRIPAMLMRALGGFQRLTMRERKRFARDVHDAIGTLPQEPAFDGVRAALQQLHSGRDMNDLAYFQMNTPPPQPKHGPPALELPLDGRKLSGLRTDLDGFGEIEMAALVNHGYDTADRFVRAYMDNHARPEWANYKPVAPKPIVGGARVEKIIAAGAARFGRAIAVRAPFTMLMLGAVAAALAIAALRGAGAGTVWTWLRGVLASAAGAAASLLRVLPEPVATFVGAILTFIPDVIVPLLAQYVDHPAALLLAVAAAVALAARRRSGAQRRRMSRTAARLRTVWKWTASWLWNVLWLAWALPLVIAATSSSLAIVSWICFFLPWRAHARITAGDVVPARRPDAVATVASATMQPR